MCVFLGLFSTYFHVYHQKTICVIFIHVFSTLAGLSLLSDHGEQFKEFLAKDTEVQCVHILRVDICSHTCTLHVFTM